jgi:RND family efflux transporter MFP subunit
MVFMNHKVLIGVLVAGTVGLSSCSSRPDGSAAVPATFRNVPVLAVENSKMPDLLEAVGTVRASQTSTLASQMMGNILEVRAREGDRVQQGQVLAVIDDSQPRAAVNRATAAEAAAQQQFLAADADLTLAEATLRRYQVLFDKQTISAQEFDVIKARYKSALAHRDMAQADQAQSKAALAEAHTLFDYTRIRAPFDGVITEKRADPGTLASPGMPIFTIEDVRHYRLEANVNEADLAYVKIGQEAPVVVDVLGDAGLKGKVTQIVPAADPGSRSFIVKVELPSDMRLRSGLFGRAQFSRGERQSLMIPRTAVVERGQLQGVFVLDANRIAGLRYVTLGKPSGDKVEVLAGLQGGERLVARPEELELDGKRIEAAQ